MDTTKLTPAQIQALRFTDEKAWAYHHMREVRGKILPPVLFMASNPCWDVGAGMAATIRVTLLGDRVIDTEVIEPKMPVITFTPGPARSITFKGKDLPPEITGEWPKS